jgi:hypothetical protein
MRVINGLRSSIRPTLRPLNGPQWRPGNRDEREQEMTTSTPTATAQEPSMLTPRISSALVQVSPGNRAICRAVPPCQRSPPRAGADVGTSSHRTPQCARRPRTPHPAPLKIATVARPCQSPGTPAGAPAPRPRTPASPRKTFRQAHRFPAQKPTQPYPPDFRRVLRGPLMVVLGLHIGRVHPRDHRAGSHRLRNRLSPYRRPS